MGSGKSSVGRTLAEELRWRFGDLDQLIEKREKRTISEIFEAGGEKAFRIAEMSAHVLTGTTRARLTVSAPPSLVERWLAPRLGIFTGSNPRVSVDIRVGDDPVDFAAEGLDLRICYGAHLYPDLEVKPLFQDRVAPLASVGGSGLDLAVRRRTPRSRVRPAL